MLKFECPFCKKKYNIPESHYGKTAQCKVCQNKFKLPDAEKVKAALAQHAQRTAPQPSSQTQPVASPPKSRPPIAAPGVVVATPVASQTVPAPLGSSAAPQATVVAPVSPAADPFGTAPLPNGFSDLDAPLENNVFDEAFFDNSSAMVAEQPLAKLPPAPKPASTPKKKRRRRRAQQEEMDEDALIPKIGWGLWFVATLLPLSLAGFLFELPLNFSSCVVITLILGGVGGLLIMPNHKIAGIISGLVFGSYITPAIYYYAEKREVLYNKEIYIVALICFLPASGVAYIIKTFFGPYED